MLLLNISNMLELSGLFCLPRGGLFHFFSTVCVGGGGGGDRERKKCRFLVSLGGDQYPG